MMGKRRRREKKTLEHPKDRPLPPAAGTTPGTQGEASLSLDVFFSQSNTMYCSCQREKEGGKQGSPVVGEEGTGERNTLNQEGGEGEGRENKRET